MRPLVLVALLASSPALAQTGDATLAPAVDALRADLGPVMHLAATVALAHERTGAFPASAFDLLGRSWSTDPGVRAVALSSLDVATSGEGVQIDDVALPSPYVRDDDDGGHPIPFDAAGRYRVERASGTFCPEADRLGARVGAGESVAVPGVLSREPLTMRVIPLGETEPTVYRVIEDAR